ncbi:MAG: hypothetical protein GY934_09015, partial [Gammaproteobacteria bacterium]|nr:hypothetical protein [Gammaproteobacteria bacterium]
MASNITKPTLSFVGRPLRHKMSDTSDLAVNGAFAADTDWDKSDAALTIAAGVADWTGAQAGNADLSPTVPILTVGKTYFIKFTLTRTAGTLTTLCGSGTSGAALSASGNYVERLVCTGSTDLILRGDSSFIGTIDDVEVFLWVGSTDSGGGITYAGALAASTGGLFDPALIMHADGSPLYNNAGCTLSDSGGYVKITDAGNFGTDIPAGTLVNCDFSADFTDGVYEITASDADSITIDLAWGASVATAEVWVGGAFPNCQAAWDDDSTDVLDSAGNYHHRHIMTNVDEEFASSQTPAGGDRGSS